jgi:hypothetical protein
VHYNVVVLQIGVQDCTVDVTQYYTIVASHIFMLHVQPAPCMYLQSFISPSPRFYSPCLHVQMSYKSYNIYSSEMSNIFASEGNDRDHAHVFFKSHTMVLFKPNGLEYPLQYTVKIMDTHFCDDLFSCTLYTRQVLFSPFFLFYIS